MCEMGRLSTKPVETQLLFYYRGIFDAKHVIFEKCKYLISPPTPLNIILSAPLDRRKGENMNNML